MPSRGVGQLKVLRGFLVVARQRVWRGFDNGGRRERARSRNDIAAGVRKMSLKRTTLLWAFILAAACGPNQHTPADTPDQSPEEVKAFSTSVESSQLRR